MSVFCSFSFVNGRKEAAGKSCSGIWWFHASGHQSSSSFHHVCPDSQEAWSHDDAHQKHQNQRLTSDVDPKNGVQSCSKEDKYSQKVSHRDGSLWPWPLTSDHQSLIPLPSSSGECLSQIWGIPIKDFLKYRIQKNRSLIVPQRHGERELSLAVQSGERVHKKRDNKVFECLRNYVTCFLWNIKRAHWRVFKVTHLWQRSWWRRLSRLRWSSENRRLHNEHTLMLSHPFCFRKEQQGSVGSAVVRVPAALSNALPSEYLPHHGGLLGRRALQETLLSRPAQPAGHDIRQDIFQDHRGLGKGRPGPRPGRRVGLKRCSSTAGWTEEGKCSTHFRQRVKGCHARNGQTEVTNTLSQALKERKSDTRSENSLSKACRYTEHCAPPQNQPFFIFFLPFLCFIGTILLLLFVHTEITQQIRRLAFERRHRGYVQ